MIHRGVFFFIERGAGGLTRDERAMIDLRLDPGEAGDYDVSRLVPM